MSGFHVISGGRKGAAPRNLAAKVETALEPLRQAEPQGDVVLGHVLQRAQRAANQVIAFAPAGSIVTTQLQVVPDPVCGWSVSILVDVNAGPEPKKSGKPKREAP